MILLFVGASFFVCTMLAMKYEPKISHKLFQTLNTKPILVNYIVSASRVLTWSGRGQ